MAVDAVVEIIGPAGVRSLPFSALHRMPGDAPDIETTLRPGEMISSFFVPATSWAQRSLFVKVRDRESYEFAVASAAVALDLVDGLVRTSRIALGGVATVPWRAERAEDTLRGKLIDERASRAAAETAFAAARPSKHNAFKIELGKRTLMRALQGAAALPG